MELMRRYILDQSNSPLHKQLPKGTILGTQYSKIPDMIQQQSDKETQFFKYIQIMQNLLSLMYFLFALQRQSDIIVHIYTQEA